MCCVCIHTIVYVCACVYYSKSKVVFWLIHFALSLPARTVFIPMKLFYFIKAFRGATIVTQNYTHSSSRIIYFSVSLFVYMLMFVYSVVRLGTGTCMNSWVYLASDLSITKLYIIHINIVIYNYCMWV